jgi:hypothetical protein
LFQSQAKTIAEQRRFPFATDNDSTNEELGETWVRVFCRVRLELVLTSSTGRWVVRKKEHRGRLCHSLLHMDVAASNIQPSWGRELRWDGR